MSEENTVTNPKTSPETAAQEIVLTMIKSGLISSAGQLRSDVEHASLKTDAIIAAHKKLTTYYQSLKK